MATPFLVVRASIDEALMQDFVRWYVKEHLPHVMAIPGIQKAYRSACHRKGINWTAVYELADESSVQGALTSSQADIARRDWERWLPHVTELSIEVYTPLSSTASFHHLN